MKAGPEAHFLSGQLFTLGIAAIAIVPRMPSDKHPWTIGGRLSFPFRRALIGLVIIGLLRVICFHTVPIDSNQLLLALDAIFGTINVIGQSFLCLTTPYLLQRQLSNYINIEGGAPGRNLVPFLVAVCFLAIAGSLFSNIFNPGWACLINVAEGISCYPVIKTLRLYTSVTTPGSAEERMGFRGPVLTQMLLVAEFWYLTTSVLSLVGEALDKTHGNLDEAEGHFFKLLSIAVRHNQDNGVDDWMRLLLHAVFLNSIDELNHAYTPERQRGGQQTSSSSQPPTPTKDHVVEEIPSGDFVQHPLVLRSRPDRGHSHA